MLQSLPWLQDLADALVCIVIWEEGFSGATKKTEVSSPRSPQLRHLHEAQTFLLNSAQTAVQYASRTTYLLHTPTAIKTCFAREKKEIASNKNKKRSFALFEAIG